MATRPTEPGSVPGLRCLLLACLPPVCGNGTVGPGEECDFPDDLACPGFCQADCTCSPAAPPPPVCGNGVLESVEECDPPGDPGPLQCALRACNPACTCQPAACLPRGTPHPTKPCIQLGGGCWILSAPGDSCDQACINNGLVYDNFTRTFTGDDAGGGGDFLDSQCAAVLCNLRDFNTSGVQTSACLTFSPQGELGGLGCCIFPDGSRRRCTDVPSSQPDTPPASDTTASAAFPGIERACACQ